jgi:hypothetical protein
MNNLQYIELAESFYNFKYIANKNNFYNECIDEMEKSIEIMNPLNYLHDNNNSNERKEMK